MTKGEIRKARKEGSWQASSIELDANGQPEMVRTRTRREEARHAHAMDRWACRYDDLNGAPESWEDC